MYTLLEALGDDVCRVIAREDYNRNFREMLAYIQHPVWPGDIGKAQVQYQQLEIYIALQRIDTLLKTARRLYFVEHIKRK